jgi:hypothetical protein
MTQQNAALVEQAAAAAESMQEQAVKLAQAVSVFKMHGSGGHMAVLGAPQAAEAVAPQPAASAARTPAPVKSVSTVRMKAPSGGGALQPSGRAKVPAPSSNGDDWEEF